MDFVGNVEGEDRLLFFLLENPGHNKTVSWTSSRFAPWRYHLQSGDQTVTTSVRQPSDNNFEITCGEQALQLAVTSLDGNTLIL